MNYYEREIEYLRARLARCREEMLEQCRVAKVIQRAEDGTLYVLPIMEVYDTGNGRTVEVGLGRVESR